LALSAVDDYDDAVIVVGVVVGAEAETLVTDVEYVARVG
jgi:hypothetical protein